MKKSNWTCFMTLMSLSLVLGASPVMADEEESPPTVQILNMPAVPMGRCSFICDGDSDPTQVIESQITIGVIDNPLKFSDCAAPAALACGEGKVVDLLFSASVDGVVPSVEDAFARIRRGHPVGAPRIRYPMHF